MKEPIEGAPFMTHSRKPRALRKIEQGGRDRDLIMATEPIPSPEAPEDAEELPYTLKIEEDKEDDDDPVTAPAGVRIRIPPEKA